MTNAELNNKLFLLIHGEQAWYDWQTQMRKFPDYCNNWNDLMPLCLEHGIGYEMITYGTTVEFTGAHVMTSDASGYEMPTHIVHGDTVQRALAECLLTVLETKDA